MPMDPGIISVDTWWFSEILRYGDRLHLARHLVEEHQGHETATSGVGEAELDEQILMCRRHIAQYIPADLNAPPLRVVEQMVYGVRGFCRMTNGCFGEGVKLVFKMRSPVAVWLTIKWLARMTFPGHFVATPRIRYDFPSEKGVQS